jgi:uncharacterized protein
MKAYFLLLIAALVAAPKATGQHAVTAPPLITTSGLSQIRVVPDIADLYFEVEIRNPDLSAARKQHAERVTKVLAALRAAGIAEIDLQSSQVQIVPQYVDRNRDTDKIQFYKVSQVITCTLREIKKIPDVTAEAVVAGATGVRDASLRTSQPRRYRDEARAKAIRAAREKAIALAGELGARVGKPYSITEGADYDWRTDLGNTFQTIATAGEQAGDGTTPVFAPGTISISANVRVAFYLE